MKLSVHSVDIYEVLAIFQALDVSWSGGWTKVENKINLLFL